MTPEQIQIVRLSLAKATAERHAVGQDFYRRLFVIAPELRARFSGDVDAESAKLADTLTLAFGALSDLAFLVSTLEALARRGVARGLPDHHCRAIAQALLWAIERCMGRAAFTPQVCDAWIALFAVVMTFLRGPVAVMQRSRAA
jgi:hemoglobin-like flavoprotein